MKRVQGLTSETGTVLHVRAGTEGGRDGKHKRELAFIQKVLIQRKE